MCQFYRNPYFRTFINNLNRSVKAAIYEFRNEHWKNILNSFSAEDNANWKATSRIIGTHKCISAINNSNGMAYMENAKAIAESLSSPFTLYYDLDNTTVTAAFIAVPDKNLQPVSADKAIAGVIVC